jgi:hypothetical protein
MTMKRRDVIVLAARTVVLAFLGEPVLVVPAYADDNVLCVQQQLAGRGLNPGPLDGVLGGRTLDAARSAAAAGGLRLAPLASGTAAAWCQALRLPDSTTVGSIQTVTVQNTEPNRSRRRYCLDPDPDRPNECR